MNAFAAAESDLALRNPRAPNGGGRRISTFSRVLAAIVLCGAFAVTLPSSGIADTRGGGEDADTRTRDGLTDDTEAQTPDDGVDWRAIRTTPPEEWSEELKAQLISAGYDIDRIAASVRKGQANAVWREAMSTPQEEWSDELIAKMIELKPDATIEEIAEGIHGRLAWSEAIATDPDEWSEELKAQLLELKPDASLEEIAEGIRKRQQDTGDKEEVGLRIRAAVEAGEMTPEEGRRRYAAYLKTQGSKSPDLEAIGRRIRTAIANGDLTPEEGREKYEAARSRLQGERKDDADLQAIGRRLKAAVENGDMTAEEARRRYAAIVDAKKSSAPDLEAIGRRLRAAVENGDMTAEEARRRYAAFLENHRDEAPSDSDRLTEFKRQVVAEALATPPSEWSDELKIKITRLGWDLDEFTEGILARQDLAGETISQSRDNLSQGTRDAATSESRPRAYSLRSRGPNPFNPQTSLQYALPEAGDVRIVVYSLTGQVVRTLVNQQMPAGSYQLVWDGTSDTGREVSSGVYLIDMKAGTFSDILKVTLAK
jgi:polyhydroxyalkanoate synthesis regulator phasin